MDSWYACTGVAVSFVSVGSGEPCMGRGISVTPFLIKTNIQNRQMKRVNTPRFLYFLLVAVVLSIPASAKTIENNLTAKGRSVFIATKDSGEYAHLSRALDYWGYWNVVSNADDADFIMRIKSRKGLNYRAYLVLINPDTEEQIWRSRKVGTFWSFSFNPKTRAMRKLVRKRLKHHFH